MTQTTSPPLALAAPFSFLGVPTWIRAGRLETNGALSMVEQVIPVGFESPWHLHHDEDESFYVIEGEVSVVVGDRSIALNPGDYAFGPRGVAHGFRILGGQPARLLLMTTGSNFADFVYEASELSGSAAANEPPDFPKVMAAAERCGLTILGPMPV